MLPSRALILVAILAGCAGQAGAADVTRFDGGRGNLVSRIGNSEWQGVRLGDEIPDSSHLRTSPAGPVRIGLPSAVLCLAGETDVDLHVEQKRIVVERGRILLRHTGEEGSWTLVTGTTTFRCSPGSEVEVSYAESIGVNVLKGAVEVTHPNAAAEARTLNGPLEWIGNNEGVSQTSEPAGDEWAARIRRRIEPSVEQGMGQLLAKDAQSGSPVRLEIAWYHVNVVLQPPVALVQIDQSFFNPHSRQEEGTFVFNLPAGASVSRFAMFVTPDQLIEGELIDRKEADRVYTTIVRSKRDPAILEQIGTNLFRMRVFPIFAKDTKRILLDYTVPLVAEQGRYRFALPLMSDLKPIWDFGMTGVIHPPFAAGSISSQTHPQLEFVPAQDGSVRFSYQAKQIQPAPKLLVDFRAADDRQPLVRSFVADEQIQHFVATIPESSLPKIKRDQRPIDLLVLVDTSGSASDLKSARASAKTLVNNLSPQDRWQLGCIDVGYRPVTSEWLEPRSVPARAALRELDNLFSLGASRLDASLEESLHVFATSPENRRRAIVYLGDGEADAAEGRSCWKHELFQKSNPTRAEFHAVKSGDDRALGQWLITGTKQTGGRLFNLQAGTEELRDLFEWTLAGMPVATDIASCRIENVPDEDLFHDGVWRQGREFHVYGRCKPTQSLDLKLKLLDQPEQAFRLNFVDERRETDVFTGRVWAQKKLETLLSTTSNLDHSAVESLVRLCQEWTLMSPYTAFLVLETEKDYETWRIPRRLRHRYWKPSNAAEAIAVHARLKQLTHEKLTQAAARRTPTKTRTPPSTKLDQRQRAGIRRHLDAAKEALVQGNAKVAMAHLNAERRNAIEVDPDEFEALLAETRQGLKREVTFSELRHWQRLVDRRASDPLPAVTPLLLGFSHVGVNPEYLERHPQTQKLMTRAPEFRSDPIPLTEFAKTIQRTTGVPVLIDWPSLKDAGYTSIEVGNIERLQGIPTRTVFNFALDPLQLTFTQSSHLLRITTAEKAEEHLATYVYPVVDLLRTDVLPLPSRLPNPILDHEILQRNATELQLKRPISVQFEETPLEDALDFVFSQMNGTRYWIDLHILADAGISPKKAVSLTADNWPADVVLNEILSEQQLENVIRDGICTITTAEKANEMMETRVYSAAGLVMERALDERMIRQMKSTGFGLGFGGGMGGGFGGPMGGMGGGLGGMGGMGGMGGGISNWDFGAGEALGGMIGDGIGGLGGADGDDIVNTKLGLISPPQVDDPESQVGPTEMPEFLDPFSRSQFFSPVSQTTAYDFMTPMQLMRQNTPAKWEDDDGEGGSLNIHLPSFSFVIRQTQKSHREIKELFSKLRRQTPTGRFQPSILTKKSNLRLTPTQNYSQIMSVIRAATYGKWEDNDGEGGSVLPHPPTESLVITQTDKVHEEIEQLLAQLRRARYIAESLPFMTSLEGIDDLITALDRPTMTDLPRNGLEAKPAGPDLVVQAKQLSVRQPPAFVNQTWRSVAAVNRQQREFSIRRHENRLELVLLDRTLRAEGPLAAVAYPGLTLVEIDAWGDAVRQVADSYLPWMPHRSNSELFQQFDVTVESEDATTSTLRLAFPGHSDTYLRVTFSKQSGEPVKWQSILVDQLQYELQFSPQTVIAVDATGVELERWELVKDDALETLPSLDEGWGDFILVEPAKPDVPFAKARNAIRSGQSDVAVQTLAKLVLDRPNQPLLNFLYAWSLRVPDRENADQTRALRESLTRLALSGPTDLLRLVTPESFPSIGAGGLREILLTVPEERRTDEVWNRLYELAAELKRFDLALTEIDRAISLTNDQTERIRRHVARVELLLKNSRPIEAEKAAMTVVEAGVAPIQLAELGDMFGRAGRTAFSALLFDKYRQTPKLTRVEKAESAYRQALWLNKGEARWRLMLEAYSEQSMTTPHLLDTILAEADEHEDAEILGKLASEFPSGPLQTRLLLRQAEVTSDTAVAAEIVSKLLSENRLPSWQTEWAVHVFERDGRSRDIVEILEQRLRQRQKLDKRMLDALSVAYQRLGRTLDSRRAATEEPAKAR